MSSGLNGLGSRIQAAREERGFTRKELARRVGVTQTAVWYWENQGKRPRPALLPVLTRVLGVNEDFADANSKPAPRTVASILYEARTQIADIIGVTRSRVALEIKLISGPPLSSHSNKRSLAVRKCLTHDSP